ncbi:MAG: VirB4 family type IV secretion/conjugal transfer ATPase [Steroidobacteraceae bacterium]
MLRNTAGALGRELEVQRHVPYSAHVAPGVLRTRNGEYLQVFRLGGQSFESADALQINGWHERLNVLWRNLAEPGLALWTHVVRRREPIGATEPPGPGFASRLRGKYLRRLSGERLMVNELYLAVLYRPTPGRATHLLARMLVSARPDDQARELAEALEVCARLGRTLCAALARYEPQPLSCYRDDDRWYSQLLEFLALLVSGERRRVPLPRGPVAGALGAARLYFGNEVIEYRMLAGTRAGAMLGIKEYPTPSVPGMLDALLAAPFPFVLTQSFVFLSKASSQQLLTRQINRMANAGDFAVSQAAELAQALDALTSNEFVMGEHHLSLQVLADLEEQPAGMPDRPLEELDQHLARARTLLADTGMTVAREDLGLEAAFWAQLPGNFAFRPRRAPITSRNFSALVPFHNFPAGRASGNHWGEALAILQTRAHSAFHFSLHAAEGSEGGGRDTGHTFICGPTGSGKTALIGFLVAMLTRCGATQVILDKDRGLEILVRALGGQYLPLRNGQPTGFNPLQLPPTAGNVEFLRSWLELLGRPPLGGALTVREVRELDQALRGTLALAPEARRLSRLLEFLDATDPEGLHGRLARWSERARGEYAWVFDNPSDTVAGQLSRAALVGFDVTEFLEHERCRAPISLYLLHLVRQLLDGRRLVCWIDEFWRLIEDPAFEQFAKDGPKTWRKLNGVMVVATQSASDVLGSRISRTVIEQTPTKIFFPNPTASGEEFVQGFGLTRREFALIKEELEPGARSFLVKQGSQSVVCRLELSGLEAEVEVLSARSSGLRRLEPLLRERGADPLAWLDAFLAAPAAE